jgi:hypothetical protein
MHPPRFAVEFHRFPPTTSCWLRHEYVDMSRQPPGSLQHRERTSMRRLTTRTRRAASSNNFVMIPANIHYYEIQILGTVLREERRVANKPWFPLCIAKIDSPSCGIRQASCQDPGPDKLYSTLRLMTWSSICTFLAVA